MDYLDLALILVQQEHHQISLSLAFGLIVIIAGNSVIFMDLMPNFHFLYFVKLNHILPV
jgi:hypothetical protein